ncbi:MAG: hypothetical protein COB51_12875 [Moraxellaceae bacterium]|nr:MAG: hypothetical protein COB51_12875 [Moraxellaceae bacterium]
MASYTTNDFRSGLKFMLNGEPVSIVENNFVRPGKGQAFAKTKVLFLLTGRTIEKTFKSGESFESADVMETDMEYLYTDGEFWHFMDPTTFEQVAADAKAVGDNAKWLTVIHKPNPTHTMWHDRYTLESILDLCGFEISCFRYYYGNKRSYNFFARFLTFRQGLLVICHKKNKEEVLNP